jgi:starvation-inducible DNA-binding protein
MASNKDAEDVAEIMNLKIVRSKENKIMPKKDSAKTLNDGRVRLNAQPRLHQRAGEIQAFGTVSHQLPLDLEEPVRLEMTEQLNLMLADTITLRDLYKKSHWQVSGPTFYQLHLLFDKHFDEQTELVDTIAERIQLLGGISIAMAHDVAETTRIERPPKGREEVPVQISRLLDAHHIVISNCRTLAERANQLGDAGTNDLVVSDILRTNELQQWFLSEHLVEEPLVKAEEPSLRSAS